MQKSSFQFIVKSAVISESRRLCPCFSYRTSQRQEGSITSHCISWMLMKYHAFCPISGAMESWSWCSKLSTFMPGWNSPPLRKLGKWFWPKAAPWQGASLLTSSLVVTGISIKILPCWKTFKAWKLGWSYYVPHPLTTWINFPFTCTVLSTLVHQSVQTTSTMLSKYTRQYDAVSKCSVSTARLLAP